LHARLIDTLTAKGAKAIIFDILFTGPSPDGDPKKDAQLAAAITRSQRVILAGNMNQDETLPGAKAEWQEVPYQPFAAGAVGWGNANLISDPDYGVRAFFPNVYAPSRKGIIYWLPWVAAQFVGAPVEKLDPMPAMERWLNYCGPRGSVPSASLYQVLLPDGVGPNFCKGKAVFVGAKSSAGFAGSSKDEFAGPYTRWDREFYPGVEIHATAFLNMVHGDWLSRPPFAVELAAVILWAAVVGFGLAGLRPWVATAATLICAILIAVAAHLLVWHGHIWFSWITLELQLGLALFASVVYNTFRLYVERQVLQRDLEARLSKAVVKRLLKDPSLRQPGGQNKEISIMFTDMANFSKISHTENSDHILKFLNRYYSEALECVHREDGTVIDLMGDGIFAIWNAPIDQSDHRERACRAAMALHGKLVEFAGREHTVVMRTRIGLHSGVACVGNIGSAKRFNYTAIGSNINLTSRLESLNKHLHTNILTTAGIEEAVRSQRIIRYIGALKLKGIGFAVKIYELLPPPEIEERSRAWRAKFAEALRSFFERRWDAAERAFQDTIALRKTAEGSPANSDDSGELGDGPSRFYLGHIREFRVTPPPDDWIGEVEVKEK
jgi:adenylate cyclase